MSFTTDHLKQRLQSSSISQKQIAILAGVTKSHVSMVLSGKRKSRRLIKIIRKTLEKKQSECPHPFDEVETLTKEDVPEKPHMIGSYCGLCGKKLTEDDL